MICSLLASAQSSHSTVDLMRIMQLKLAGAGALLATLRVGRTSGGGFHEGLSCLALAAPLWPTQPVYQHTATLPSQHSQGSPGCYESPKLEKTASQGCKPYSSPEMTPALGVCKAAFAKSQCVGCQLSPKHSRDFAAQGLHQLLFQCFVPPHLDFMPQWKSRELCSCLAV